MSVFDERVYLVGCDDCDDVLEGDFGDPHFEDENDAIAEAKRQGWQMGTGRWADAVCPDCLAKRKRAEEGKPELPVEIPGQLDLLAEVTR